MKRYEFTEGELTDKAFETYSNSSFAFYKKNNVFFVADNQNDEAFEVGNIDDCIEYLEQF